MCNLPPAVTRIVSWLSENEPGQLGGVGFHVGDKSAMQLAGDFQSAGNQHGNPAVHRLPRFFCHHHPPFCPLVVAGIQNKFEFEHQQNPFSHKLTVAISHSLPERCVRRVGLVLLGCMGLKRHQVVHHMVQRLSKKCWPSGKIAAM